MQKVCYIISGIDKALAFEWITEKINQDKFQLSFILLHHKKGELEQYLIDRKIPVLHIPYSSKLDLIPAIFKTYKYLKQNKICTVHCHLLDAGLAGIVSACLAKIPNRIYSRHYSTYHHTYHPKGVFYDKIINALSTKIIAVSKVVEEVLVDREKVDPQKITVIYHGFPLQEFSQVNVGKIATLQRKYGIDDKRPVIGVISRYTKWKGIQYIIDAFKIILNKFPNAYLVLANAKGDYKEEIEENLKSLPSTSYKAIVFEADLFSLYHCFDVFVHVPIDHHSEAFGQVYVEALAAGIPSVVTLSGIGNEIIVDRNNALVVTYQDSVAIYEKVTEILENKELREQLIKNGKNAVENRFELENMVRNFEKLYE